MRTNAQVMERMAEDLKLRGLAAGTQEDYLMHAGLFLKWAGRPVMEMDEENIRAYLNYLISEKKLAVATVNSYNAVSLYVFS